LKQGSRKLNWKNENTRGAFASLPFDFCLPARLIQLQFQRQAFGLENIVASIFALGFSWSLFHDLFHFFDNNR
jgi:hypothetical protein